ncbi:MAG: hypothetical protein IIB99_10475, partial [Planctomycetes bacterium]|nr:hypothetical protein [Planctomycetota bacterium]
GANAVVKAIVALRAGAWSVAALQDYFPSHEPGRSQDALDIQTVQAQAGPAQEAAKNR